MPYNGSGTFNRNFSWVTDAANGLLVSSSRMDADTNDIASGLTDCITKDGQSTPTANIPMGGFKVTNLGLGTAATDAARIDNANLYNVCEFRLCGQSGTPVGEIGGSNSIFLSPYKGNRIALYDGANWHMRNSTELSVTTNPGLAVSTVYDVFVFDNAGVPTLETVAWTNDTTRAGGLTVLSGVITKSDVTRRYVGTFRTDAGSHVNDTVSQRWIWNYYNRVARPMKVFESTASWAYTTATVRQARATATNQLDFVIGFSEDVVSAELEAIAANTAAGVLLWSGIGLDSTTTPSTDSNGGAFTTVGAGATLVTRNHTTYRGLPGVGRHTLTWLEFSSAVGTTTWYGTSGGLGLGDKNGLSGVIFG